MCYTYNKEYIMTIDIKKRVLDHLAYRYWKKDKTRSKIENWKKAEKLLNYIEKRKALIERLIK